MVSLVSANHGLDDPANLKGIFRADGLILGIGRFEAHAGFVHDLILERPCIINLGHDNIVGLGLYAFFHQHNIARQDPGFAH